MTVYDGALENTFADYYSWAGSYNFSNANPTFGGESHSIRFKPDNWGGVRILGGDGAAHYPIANYGSLTFQVNGGSGGGQKVTVALELITPGNNQTAVFGSFDIGSHISGGTIAAGSSWQQVTLDFDVLGLTYGEVNAIVLQADSSSNATQPDIYLSDIVFNARSTPIANGGAVNVSVDTSSVGKLLNPLIFGVAYGDAARNGQIGYSVRRWGGNSTTRYNWKVDVNNTGSDYYYENIPGSSDRSHVPPLGNAADAFISGAISSGSAPLITIPTIGWTPRADSTLTHPYTVGFAVSKYGAQQSVDYWDNNAGNGYYTNGSAITGNDPTESSTAIDPSFEQGWIAHLQSAFGGAAQGGVRYYTLDNEVMLWNSTHRDVHPSPPTQTEIWDKTLSYGTAIKQQDPNARVTGPVTWGYCDLFWSASDNCGQSNKDRSAHGGLPFIAWYLQQNCANARIVDFLDLHYYPQGQNVSLSDDDSPATAGLRLRALRELYDANWDSQSWINDLGDTDVNHYSKPNLITRARGWIDQYCPRTRLAITEYNWGNDNTTSGTVAQTEVLAIYAREGVDMATRWVAPVSGSKAENAFSVFLNYDGAGTRVQGNSVKATSSNLDQIGAYAFDIPGQRTMLLLTNKDLASHDVNVAFNAARTGMWKRFGFSGSGNLAQIGSASSISGTSLTVSSMPPMSVSMIEVTGTPVGYVPLVPARLLDMRPGSATSDDLAAGTGALGAKASYDLPVLGRGGVPANGVVAVAMNITLTAPSAAGFVTVWPTGNSRPNASNLNFLPGDTIANFVISKVGSNGKISLFNSAGTNNLIADVVGYFTDSSALNSLLPFRLLDTRSGFSTGDGAFAGIGALAGNSTLDLTVQGRAGLPPNGIGAVVMNVTATQPTGAGYVTVWPSGAPRPYTSNLNFSPGQTIPNLVISKVSNTGKVSLFNSSGTTDLIADIVGWFPTTSELSLVGPARLLDTRAGTSTIDGQFAGIGALSAQGTLDLLIAGRGGVPSSGVGAVVLNVTVTNPNAASYVTSWPSGSARPNASNVNFVAGETIPNLVIAKIGNAGKISLFNAAGSTDLVVDVMGWFPATP